MGFNVNAAGDATATDGIPSDLFAQIQQVAETLAEAEVQNRIQIINEQLSMWDGATFNGDDINNMMTALMWAAKQAEATGLAAIEAVDFADLESMNNALGVMGSAKRVIMDALVLRAKLRHVLETHPHTLTVTPF